MIHVLLAYINTFHANSKPTHNSKYEVWFDSHTHTRMFNANFMLCTIQNANDNKTNKLTTKHNVMSTNSNRSCRSLSSHSFSFLLYLPSSLPQFGATVRFLYGFMCRCRSSLTAAAAAADVVVCSSPSRHHHNRRCSRHRRRRQCLLLPYSCCCHLK